jgi:hypothetical protein
MALFNGGGGQQQFGAYQTNQYAQNPYSRQPTMGPPQQFTGGLDPVFVRRPTQRPQVAMPEYNRGYQFNQQPQQPQGGGGGLAGGVFAPGYQGPLNDAFPANNQGGGMGTQGGNGWQSGGSPYQGLAGPGYSTGSYQQTRQTSMYQQPTQFYQYGTVNGMPFGNQYAMPASAFQNTKWAGLMQ